MRRFWVVLVALLALAMLGGQMLAADKGQDKQFTQEQKELFARLPEVNQITLDQRGVPDFIIGRLGTLRSFAEADAVEFMRSMYPAFGAAGNEDLRAKSGLRDDLGQVHLKFQQYLHGLPVVGAEMILHADESTGEVRAVNGSFYPNTDDSLPSHAQIRYNEALDIALEQTGIIGGEIMERPRLTYVMDEGKVYLAWTTRVLYNDLETGAPRMDRIFADAVTGDLTARHGIIKEALNRKVYTANHGTSTPGTLVISEGGSSSDVDVQTCYNHVGTTYNYYKARFNRDSINNSGMTLIATVHYSNSYVNAYWDGSQFVFGDGDNSQASSLARDLDVVAHEYTHGVTDYTANLTYSNESGALNEAMSDIFAVSTEAYSDGAVSANTWKVGEDCWTPATSGDALRYMNNPTADGQSYDYYPERYTGTSDYGGVHLNSGIGNLAYYLLCQGGTHPRSKTTVQVTGIGMSKAEQIVYRALTTYMTASTNFAAARTAYASAATDLYGASSNEVTQSNNAWAAVGVGSGTTPPATVVTLTNGQTVSNLSVSAGAYLNYKITVPSGQTSLVIKTTGGTGDADLYAKIGSSPTSSSYTWNSAGSSAAETITVSNPTAGDYYISIYGYSAASGFSLNATYTGGTTPPSVITLTNGQTVSGISVAKGAYANYKIAVPASQTSLVVKTTGGTADADLYVKIGSSPTTSSYTWSGTGSTSVETITISNPTAGDYYISIYGYAASSSISLNATYTAGTTPPAGNTETESNGTTGTANTLTTGAACTGKISSSSDIDYFKISVATGKTVAVNLVVPSGKDYDVKVYNSSNTQVASGTNGAGTAENVSFSNSTGSTQTYYIKVYGYNGAYSTTLNYTVKATW
ncbi:MAG: M4 family metallopeptidase [Acidobacteria bacterium]|nr:M4 family metallopeptidase [Acidobacteriota bacterium]